MQKYPPSNKLERQRRRGGGWLLVNHRLGSWAGFIPKTFLETVCSFESETEHPNRTVFERLHR